MGVIGYLSVGFWRKIRDLGPIRIDLQDQISAKCCRCKIEISELYIKNYSIF